MQHEAPTYYGVILTVNAVGHSVIIAKQLMYVDLQLTFDGSNGQICWVEKRMTGAFRNIKLVNN